MTIVLEYFASIALVGKRPGMISTGVFGFPMDKVARYTNNILIIY